MAAHCSHSRAGWEPSSLQGGSGPAVHWVPSQGRDCQDLKGLSQISAGTGNVTQRAPTTCKTIPLEKYTNRTCSGVPITAMNIRGSLQACAAEDGFCPPPLRSAGATWPRTGMGGLMPWKDGSRMERGRALRLKQLFLRLGQLPSTG